jgi:hypothetical protein
MFESIQIKTVLNRRFEMVLKPYSKHSKLNEGNARKSGISALPASVNQSVWSGFINGVGRVVGDAGGQAAHDCDPIATASRSRRLGPLHRVT